MIKQSVFKDELIAGMQRKLAEQYVTPEINDLPKAAEYLQSAMDLFEDIGMTNKAEQVLDILKKLAAIPMPTLEGLENFIKRYDLKLSDLNVLMEPTTHRNGPLKAKVMKIFMKPMGLSRRDIMGFYGNKAHLLSDPQIEHYSKTTSVEEATKAYPTMQEAKLHESPNFNPGLEFPIKSIAEAIKDWRTQGLTSEQMIKNLLDHGTEFNMKSEEIHDKVPDELYVDDDPTFEDE